MSRMQPSLLEYSEKKILQRSGSEQPKQKKTCNNQFMHPAKKTERSVNLYKNFSLKIGSDKK